MRYINKANEPQALLDFKRDNKNIPGVDVDFDMLPKEVKNPVKSALLDEQYHICCYCMNHIEPDDSHIEHIKPRSQFKQEALDYDNMLASCNGIGGTRESCGHNKDNWYDAKDFLTPLDPDCEKIYTYTISGTMDATENKGKVTITKLNLNSALLIRARKTAIGNSGLFDVNFMSKKQNIIDYYSNPDTQKHLPSFCMAVLYCVDKYGA